MARNGGESLALASPVHDALATYIMRMKANIAAAEERIDAMGHGNHNIFGIVFGRGADHMQWVKLVLQLLLHVPAHNRQTQVGSVNNATYQSVTILSSLCGALG